MTIAAIMTETCCAMPTAVMTESSEKTMSSSTIWQTACRSAAPPAAAVQLGLVLDLELVVDLVRRLADEEEPAASRMRSRPEMPWPHTVKSGARERP